MAECLTKKSEYFCTICGGDESRIPVPGLAVDPFTIDEMEWTREPESIPQLLWSDLMICVVSTPSPHTKEAISVILLHSVYN